jgi:hypothetical protein
MTHDDIIHYPGRDETGLFERARTPKNIYSEHIEIHIFYIVKFIIVEL